MSPFGSPDPAKGRPMHSVWYYLGSWGLDVVAAILSPLNTPNADVAPQFNSNVFETMGTALAALQVVADLQFMLGALGFLLGWRAVWFAVRLYRVVLELIPMMG